jgi:hypothetical protein
MLTLVLVLVLVLVLGTIALTPLFRALGSWDPVWADAWTFVASPIASYGMAKGWTEFWLIWIAVDVVGCRWCSTRATTRPGSCTSFMVSSPRSDSWSGRAQKGAKPRIDRVTPDPRVSPALEDARSYRFGSGIKTAPSPNRGGSSLRSGLLLDVERAGAYVFLERLEGATASLGHAARERRPRRRATGSRW